MKVHVLALCFWIEGPRYRVQAPFHFEKNNLILVLLCNNFSVVIVSFIESLSFIVSIFDYLQSRTFFVVLDIWDKLFKSGPSKICGRQPLENLKGYGLLK